MSDLTRLSLSQRRNRIVSVPASQFARIAAVFKRENARTVGFLPGAWIGPVTLYVGGKLRDVVWAGMTPFFSWRLVRALQARRVRLHPKPVTVVRGGVHLQDYCYCLPALVELCAPAFLARFYNRCQACGQITQKKGVGAVKAANAVSYMKSAWPDREGIVYSTEHLDLLFSDEFVQVCLSGGFEGLAFERSGQWYRPGRGRVT